MDRGLFKDSRAIVTRARERVKIIVGEEGCTALLLPLLSCLHSGHVHARDRDWQLARSAFHPRPAEGRAALSSISGRGDNCRRCSPSHAPHIRSIICSGMRHAICRTCASTTVDRRRRFRIYIETSRPISRLIFPRIGRNIVTRPPLSNSPLYPTNIRLISSISILLTEEDLLIRFASLDAQ